MIVLTQRCTCCVLVCWAIGLTCVAQAGPPTITKLPIPGLQIGGATTFVVEGADLGLQPRLLLNTPIREQQVKSAKGNLVEFSLTLDLEKTLPGIGLVRVVTEQGVSNALPLAIDSLPQLPFAAEVATLPAAMHGTLSGNQVLRTTFTGKKGEAIVVEIEAKRVGSSCNPVLRLLNEQRTQLAFSAGESKLSGDARLTATLPADGRYTVELHDVAYQAGTGAVFRLKIGAFPFVDLPLPLGLRQGTESKFELHGTNVAAGSFTGRAEKLMAVQPLLEPRALTGFRPGFLASDQREVLAPRDNSDDWAAPLGITGIVSKRSSESLYNVTVQPGQKLRVELFAQRLGSPLDGVVTVRDDKGKQLATGDDQPNTTDPGFDFTVPAGVTKAVFAVKDLAGRGGADYFFRLSIASAGAPDYSLSVADDRVNVPGGGTGLLKIDVARKGYTGPIRLSFANLPAMFKPSGDVIPAGANQALISFANESQQPLSQIFSIVGQAQGAELARPVLTMETATGKLQPWLRQELALTSSANSPLTVAWDIPGENTVLPLGGRLSAAVKLTLAEKVAGPVRLVLVSSQAIPKKGAKPAPKPPAKNPPPVEKPEDDPLRALRLTELVVVPVGKTEAKVEVAVPGDLPRLPYDLALRAELLSADQKGVLATAYTPVRRLEPGGGFRIELTSEPTIDARSGLGTTGKFSGKVIRSPEFKGAVILQLDGLPENAYAGTANVSADQREFEYPVTLNFGVPAGELKNVKLVGLGQPNADEPDLLVRSNEVAVSLKVVAGEKPKTEKAFEIFDESEAFVAALSEGGGQISLSVEDIFSGKAAVKVTPDQRFSEKLPSPAVKIRETPGPDEYRFVRFAWKKKGGTQICLQINHDGQWGPANGAPGKFRYHAGPGECFNGSLAVNEKTPAEWTVVTRDLFADFSAFTFTGLALSPVDGEYALFDHIYLGKSLADLDAVKK